MSAIQLLEKIGANVIATKVDVKLLKQELDQLTDTCPDIISFLVPADDDDDSEGDEQKEEDEKRAIGF